MTNRFFVVYGSNENFYKFKSVVEKYLPNSHWLQEKNKDILLSSIWAKENCFVFMSNSNSDLINEILQKTSVYPVYLIDDEELNEKEYENKIFCKDITEETIHFVYTLLSSLGEQGSVLEI